MNTLVIAAHPRLHEGSKLNKRLIEALRKDNQVTIHELYAHYPDEVFDLYYERRLLMEHDRIILQFPFWWYSSPPLLKKWLDEVMSFGFAYGPEGSNLHGKEFGLAITTGSSEESYSKDGYNQFTIEEMTRPYQAACRLIGMRFLPIFAVYGADKISDEELDRKSEQYVKHVTERAMVGQCAVS